MTDPTNAALREKLKEALEVAADKMFEAMIVKRAADHDWLDKCEKHRQAYYALQAALEAEKGRGK